MCLSDRDSGPCRPYGVDCSLACWNAEGLLAANAVKQQSKMGKAIKLAKSRDCVVLTETHGNEGKCRARRLPQGDVASGAMGMAEAREWALGSVRNG